jgi:outer membrane protein insertion porin family
MLNKDAYKPLPMGDGQSILAFSLIFSNYSVSFSEPWFVEKTRII